MCICMCVCACACAIKHNGGECETTAAVLHRIMRAGETVSSSAAPQFSHHVLLDLLLHVVFDVKSRVKFCTVD